jgi:hypothetical protein
MATMNKAAKRVRGIIRETHRWCATPSNDRRESGLKDLRKYLAKNDTTRAALVLGLGFANWYGQCGVRAVLDGEKEGWADIDRTCHYLWLRALTVHRSMQASEAASVLATAVVLDEDAMAESLATRLIRSMDDQKLFQVWEESAFATFMVKLWGLYRGLDIDVARPKIAPLRVYQAILDAWHDDAALASAVSAACDYHLEQTMEKSPYPEFFCFPFMLFPADILVIGAVRQKLGLSMPEVSHPLLDTPLAKVPPPGERPRMGADPLFDEVLARAKKDGLIV